MIVKLMIEHNLEFLSLKGDCTGSSESTLIKMSNCWKSHATARLFYTQNFVYLNLFGLFCSSQQDIFVSNERGVPTSSGFQELCGQKSYTRSHGET